MMRSGEPSFGTRDSLKSASFLPTPVTQRRDCMSAAVKRYRYLRRLFKFQQMDFEFAIWQMMYLFIAPQKVYRNFNYRKETKLQFARDDPAFLVLLSFWLCVASVGFTFVLGLSILAFFKFLLYVIFVDCIGFGICIATCLWFVCHNHCLPFQAEAFTPFPNFTIVALISPHQVGHTLAFSSVFNFQTNRIFVPSYMIFNILSSKYISNKYLIKPAYKTQDVEWGYAFDVHLNAYFPSLIILHVFQLFFYNVFISQDWFLARLFGNSLWLISIGYYIYITFLGYTCLPIVHRTQVLLYPLVPLLLVFIVSLAASWNITQSVMDFYHYRVI